MKKKKCKKNLAPERIELTTFALLARRSNQLSYGAILFDDGIFAKRTYIFTRKQIQKMMKMSLAF